MNTKKDRVLFCKEVEQILIENNGILTKFYKDWGDGYSRSEYEFKTPKNRLIIVLYGQQDQHHCYSVFGVLDTPSNKIGNPFSGKVNFHSALSALEAIADFEDHLKLITESEL